MRSDTHEANGRPGSRRHGERGPQTGHHVEAVPASVFWGLTILGLAVAGFGFYGVVVNQGTGILDVRVRPMITWVVAAIVLHDLVFAPIALLVGRGLRRVRPLALRAPLQAGLATTALVSLLAFPLVRGYGASDAAPSRLPLNYTVGYVALLIVVWTACAVWMWARSRTSPPRSRTDTG